MLNKLDKKSIVYRVTSLVIILIIAQTILLSVFLVLGGVLSQAKKNAYASFSEKVKNRNEYLQREMSNRWTNLNPYLEQIRSAKLDSGNSARYFNEVSDSIISMMRSTMATGAFLILEQKDEGDDYDCVYFRDYDPILNDYGNNDLYMIFGPADIAGRLQIPLDQMWKNQIPLSRMSREFYDEPFANIQLSDNAKLPGYWSLPFQLFSEDIPIMTYTVPLLSKDNVPIGVIGVEISVQYFSQFLPSTDLQARDSLGYFIGCEMENETGIEPFLFTRAIQNQFLNKGEKIPYQKVDKEENIYQLEHSKGKNEVYLSIEPMNLYNENTPYQTKQWYIIGMMSSNSLFSYVAKIKNIIMFSFLSSIAIGILGGYFASYQFTKPIIKLARKVKHSDFQNKLTLERTGLTEVDELSMAIQTANDTLLESTIKMSRIIDMAGLSIGAFEYRQKSDYVFVTEQLMSILSIPAKEMERLKRDKVLFCEKLEELLGVPETGEENVYVLHKEKIKWVKLKEVKTEKSTIGVIIDVTGEMLEKMDIIRERDYDYLTQVYSRSALYRTGEEILTLRQIELVAAVLMFDLDSLKLINDAYGHEWGDKYIKLAVKQLGALQTDRSMIGRRSGDEFVVLLYDFKTKKEIRDCIRNFYRSLEKDPLRLPDGSEKQVYISSGLVWTNDITATFEEYLHLADKALYHAKRNQKGTCFEYDEIMPYPLTGEANPDILVE